MENIDQIIEIQTLETNENIPMPAILVKLVNDMLDRFNNFTNINEIFDNYIFGFDVEKIGFLSDVEIKNRIVPFLRLYVDSHKIFEEILNNKPPHQIPCAFNWDMIDTFLLRNNPNITEKVHKLTSIKMEYIYWYIPIYNNIMNDNYNAVRKEHSKIVIEAYQAWKQLQKIIAPQMESFTPRPAPENFLDRIDLEIRLLLDIASTIDYNTKPRNENLRLSSKEVEMKSIDETLENSKEFTIKKISGNIKNLNYKQTALFYYFLKEEGLILEMSQDRLFKCVELLTGHNHTNMAKAVNDDNIEDTIKYYDKKASYHHTKIVLKTSKKLVNRVEKCTE